MLAVDTSWSLKRNTVTRIRRCISAIAYTDQTLLMNKRLNELADHGSIIFSAWIRPRLPVSTRTHCHTIQTIAI
jgi:hypothetical protein